MACSAGLWERHCGDTARQVLEQNSTILPPINTSTDLNHFLSLLQCWNANPDHCSTKVDNNNTDMEDTEMKEESNHTKSSKEETVVKNIAGLENCLLLWEKIVPLCRPDDPTTRQCLQLLVRLGLDMDFEPRDVIGRVLGSLLIAANLESTAVTEAASWTLEGLTELGPGLTEDDAEDTGAWLVLTEAVRLVSVYRPTATPPVVLQFHAALAQRAIDIICLKQLQNQVQHLTDDQPSLATLIQDNLCGKSLVTVCAGLEELINLSDGEIGGDPPRLQAGVESLFAMFESGMLLLEHETITEGDTNTGSTLATISRDYFTVLDPLLVALSRRLRPMVTTSHIRRSDMLLQLWHQYNIVMHRQASVKQQQKTMDSFFKPMTPSPVKRGSSKSPLRT